MKDGRTTPSAVPAATPPKEGNFSLGRWSLANRKLIYFLVAVLTVGGALAYLEMSKLEDPEIVVKQALVVTTYPGASAHQVELEVTDPLEKSIRSMRDVGEVTSRSMGDVSIISVTLSTLVPNDGVEQNWDMLRRKVGDTARSLPAGASPPVVMDNFGDVFGMFYALTSDGYSDREMARYAELVKREVLEIEGISQVNVYGERRECVDIELYEDRMATLGVMPAEVLLTLTGQNSTVYAGYYASGDERVRVAVNDRYRTVDDIGALVIEGHEGDQVRLRDIARVSKGLEKPVRASMSYDGRPALGILIAATGDSDITRVGKQVDKVLERIERETLPAGMEVEKVFFQPERVGVALGTFMINLAESLLIVIVLLMFTMGFRSGVIIGTSLLVSVFGSLLVLNLFDGTLQRVSLGAFILAMGMLVDNAIVIVDGIQIDLRRGVPRPQALTAIGRKTAMPLLGATLIAILAFFPIFVSPDTAGIYVRDLFVVLAVSLLLSWVLALSLVPIQSDAMLKVKPVKEGGDAFGGRWYGALRATLSWGIRHRWATVGIAVATVALSAFLYTLLPQGFFPDLDYDQLYIEYRLPEGNTPDRVKSDLAEIENYLSAREEVTHVTASVGGSPGRYNLVRSIATPSLSYGELIVDFTSSKELVAAIPEIQSRLTDAYPDAYVRVKRYNLMYKEFPIEVAFRGPDPQVLRELTAGAMRILDESPDIVLVRHDWEPRRPVLEIDYNQPAARGMGVTRGDVGMSVLAATEGIPVSVFHDGSVAETIYLKCVDREGRPIPSLENSPVFAMLPSLAGLNRETLQGLVTGAISEEEILEGMFATVPLSQVTGGQGINVAWEEPVVLRSNGRRVMRAQGNPAAGTSTADAVSGVRAAIEAIPLPEGYEMEWEGEAKASGEAMKYLFRNFPLAVMMMIAILIMLFRDYRKPLIIVCCIPLMMVGVVIGMFVAGKTFTFVATVAALGLIGMIVKNGIVLMDEIALQVAAGRPPVEALLESSARRFRPVTMASLTTILGMIPLVGDDMFGPGAVTIMGGLLVGTLITLLFVPVLYAVFYKIKNEK